MRNASNVCSFCRQPDVADETLVVEQDALAAERQRGARQAGVGELKAIDLVGLVIGNYRIGDHLRHRRIRAIVVLERHDRLALDEQRGVPRLAGFESQPHSQRERTGVFGQRILVDVLHAQARVEDVLGFAEGALDRIESVRMRGADREQTTQ